jgi:hypothetical protein
MVFSFEDKIKYIEMVLDLQLLDWQKKALKQVDERKEMIWIPGKASGKTVYMKAVRLLHQLNEALNGDHSDMVSKEEEAWDEWLDEEWDGD